MNSRIANASLTEEVEAKPKSFFLLRIISRILQSIFSILLALITAIFFIWVNNKQKEFDQLQDKSKND